MKSEELQAIELQLAALTARMDALEKGISSRAYQPATPVGTASPVPPPPKNTVPNYDFPDYRKRETKVNESAGRGSGWLLGAVALVCFILAAGYLIELAIDTGWLTPARQLAAAVFFGFTLIATGYFLRLKDTAYASYLPGAGIVVLFMSAYAGHLYYELYSATEATILAGVISFFCIYLFKVFQQEFFVISAAAGSYLTPLILGGKGYDPLSATYYFLFWDITFCTLAILLRRRLFIGLAAYLALAVYFALYELVALPHRPAMELTIVCFQALQFAIFLGAVAWFSIRNKTPLTTHEAWCLSPALVLFYLLEYPLVYRLSPEAAPWISLGFSASVYLVYLAAKRILGKDELESYPLVLSFVALTAFHSLYLNILPRGVLPWIALGFMAAVPWLGKRGVTFSKLPLVVGTLFAVVGLEYLRALGLGAIAQYDFANGLVNAGFAALIIAAYFQQRQAKNADASLLVLFLAHAQAMAGLRNFAFVTMPTPVVEIVCSSAWGLLALLILLAARHLRDKTLAHSALAIFAIVSVKVLFMDLSSRGTLMQIVLLVVVGALFYAGGYVLRQIDSWKPAAPTDN